MTHLRERVKRLQRKRVEQEDSWGDVRGFESEKIGWALEAAAAIFACDVVPELIGGSLGKEVMA